MPELASVRPETRGFIGHGIGLRTQHYARALGEPLDVDWVEVISENFFGLGGRPRAVLERVREQLPVVLHGVSMGIGSLDAPNASYLTELATLVEWVEPAWVSDHLCWTSYRGNYSHDLLPLPYTEEALELVADNVDRVQERLQRPLVLENVSSYLRYEHETLSEWEFLAELSRRTGCEILLDLNNIIVSARNHGFSAQDYLAGIPSSAVRQFHLANHTDRGHFLFDSHRGAVSNEVWTLYAAAIQRFGAVSSAVEWDEAVPEWELLRAEQIKAKALCQSVLAGLAPAKFATAAQASGHEGALHSGGATTTIAARERQPQVLQQRALEHCGQLETIDLAQSQELFWRAMTWPNGVSAFLRGISAEENEKFATVFQETPTFPRIARLQVYAEAYFFRLLEVLQATFPVSHGLLGEVAFHNLVTDYLWACPSLSGDVRRVGVQLPQFVASHPITKTHAGIDTLFALEAQICKALDGPDATVITRNHAAEIPVAAWPSVRFRLHPSVSLLGCAFDYVELRKLQAEVFDASRVGSEPISARPQSNSVTARPLAAEPGIVLIWRQGWQVRHRAIARAEAAALGAIQEGKTFGATCAEAEPGVPAAMIATWLGQWFDDGLVSEVLRE